MTDERTDLYEVTLILGEESTVDEAEKVIAKHSEIKKSSDLGVKSFAYPIGKLNSGRYVAIEFVAETSAISEIETELKAEKAIIRYIVTKAIRKGPETIRTGEWAKKDAEKTAEGKTSEKPEQTVQAVPEIPERKPEEQAAETQDMTQELATEEVAPDLAAKEDKQEEVKTEKKIIPAKPPVKKSAKDEQKLVTKKPRAKAEKVSADELDKKLEELVKE